MTPEQIKATYPEWMLIAILLSRGENYENDSVQHEKIEETA